MKKTIILIVCVLCSVGMMAQNSENIPVSVVVPQQVDELDASQIQRLGKKMMDAVTRSGLSSSSDGSSIIMYPLFSIEKEDVVEGGLQKIIVVNTDVSFVLKNLESEIIFASYNRQIRGSGSNRQNAINDAISKISVNDKEFSKFIEQGREKIFVYYETNCPKILLRAESCAQRQQYEEAIALLASIPDAASCYPQALEAVEKFYPAYQNQQCNVQLQKAQTLYAAHEYNAALSVLYDLKVFATDCTSEVKTLIETIEKSVSADEKRQWEFMEQQANNNATLQEKRIEAVQAIAVAYYGRKINNNYNLILH